MNFEPVESLVSEIKQGRMILLVDDEHRENDEQRLLIAAEKMIHGVESFGVDFVGGGH